MSEPREVVLIGDPEEERFTWFKELLADEYEIEAVHAKTFEDVRRFAKDRSHNLIARTVFLTDDLPFSAEPSINIRDPNLNFVRLEELLPYTDFVCIVTKEQDPDLPGTVKRPFHVHLQSFPPTAEDKERIIIGLGGMGRRLARFTALSEVVKITEWDENNRTLRRQIRSLSEKHEQADGEKHLLRLIRNCLNCRRNTTIEIKQLGQGKSGANVFHLKVNNPGQIKEYILKLIKSDALWKLESEVSGHLKAREKTGLPGYKEHVAALGKPAVSIKTIEARPEHQFIAGSGQWYAIYYDFLGGTGFGKFIDLETALTAKPQTLIKKTEDTLPAYSLTSTEPDEVLAHRLRIFTAILDGLCEIWYGRKGEGSRRVEAIWDIKDAADRKFMPLPPYQLTRRVKGRVQDFLDSREGALGARLFPRWDDHFKYVLKLVSDKSTSADLGRFSGSIPFTFSPVHGDLNANNVLLWLEYEKYLFVIDLPFYQKEGHSLQDFARLEVEIKFALLDRQEESPSGQLAAYDYTDSQVPIWIEMEKRLLESRALSESELGRMELNSGDWKADGFKDNVTFCYKLITLLRKKACEIQQRSLSDSLAATPFASEYLPALLYHTIRAISYPSLSVFKRLFAVHSSGSILERVVTADPVPRQTT
ncbi:MAG TPA: hypothetical protein VD861_18425 [Pyrinomonadaceae bacterium]|nr:hypothetical protein [Pyrinomonadaceae bacterium]